MSDVIRDIRALLHAADGAATREPVDLAALVDEETRELRERYPAVSACLSAPEGDPLVVDADDLLVRLFRNLLANAVEHNDCDDPCVEVRVRRDGEWAVVTVSDNGPGIPPEEVETLVDRVDDTASPKRGVGLYLVDRLATRYGGAVDLTENGEDGATFTVRLPLADDGASGETRADGADGSVTVTSDPTAADGSSRSRLESDGAGD
jgi:signal transduction histidine kinase